MFLWITVIVIAWMALSGFILVSVCMMSSVANRTELLTEDRLPRRKFCAEDVSAGEIPTQPSVEASTW